MRTEVAVEVTPDALATDQFNGAPESVIGHTRSEYVVGGRYDLSDARPTWRHMVRQRGYFTALPLGTSEQQQAKQRQRAKASADKLLAQREAQLKEQADLQNRILDGERVVASMEAALAALPEARKAVKSDLNRASQIRQTLEKITDDLAALGVTVR